MSEATPTVGSKHGVSLRPWECDDDSSAIIARVPNSHDYELVAVAVDVGNRRLIVRAVNSFEEMRDEIMREKVYSDSIITKLEQVISRFVVDTSDDGLLSGIRTLSSDEMQEFHNIIDRHNELRSGVRT